MGQEKSRILSLIDFSQQSARLRAKAAATVSGHGQFSFYEHEIQGLPWPLRQILLSERGGPTLKSGRTVQGRRKAEGPI
jgi:hypothetical protein